MVQEKAQRTCIACGLKEAKHNLFRIVRTPSYEIRFDESGNAAGRGAYVCSMKCFEDACTRNKFSRALRIKSDDCIMEAIKKALEASVSELAGLGE